jgi:hypothetical protein
VRLLERESRPHVPSQTNAQEQSVLQAFPPTSGPRTINTSPLQVVRTPSANITSCLTRFAPVHN